MEYNVVPDILKHHHHHPDSKHNGELLAGSLSLRAGHIANISRLTARKYKTKSVYKGRRKQGNKQTKLVKEKIKEHDRKNMKWEKQVVCSDTV